jgi:hypothetical protein
MDSRIRRSVRSSASTLGLVLITGLGLGAAPAGAASPEALAKLLGQQQCPGCRLQDADLVNANLRDANLSAAQLQRANLSGALLDGARLDGADLSFTSLQGASLRGADLRGARLEGTDLRQSDLSGALLDAGALSRSHWQQARGVESTSLSYAELHNAGVEAAMAGRHPEAERLFGDAIRQQPTAGISWLARGISRTEMGLNEQAASDLSYAASLYEQGGDTETARKLRDASKGLTTPPGQSRGGNGLGGQLLTGAAGAVQALAPLAVKFLLPMAF